MENFRFCAVSTEKKDVDFNERLEFFLSYNPTHLMHMRILRKPKLGHFQAF